MPGDFDRKKIARVVKADLARAKDYYESTIEPALKRRWEIYTASKERYEVKFPVLSEQSDYVEYQFYGYVQWAKPTILNSFFGPSQVIQILGQGAEDSPAASLMEDFINWQIVQQCHGYLVFDSWIQDALIYELGILKCWWLRETRQTHDTLKVSPQYLQELSSTPEIQILSVGEPDGYGDMQVDILHDSVVENRPMIDHISPYDLRWSPDARSLDKANFVAQRSIVSASELHQGIAEGRYDKDETEQALANDAEGVSWTQHELDANSELDKIEEDDDARRKFELYECYVRLDSDGDGILEDLIVTMCAGHVLRVEENTLGRVPFFIFAPHRDPDKVFCDMSLSEILGELQDLNTAMTRQLLVNISLNNTPREFVNEDIVDITDLLENANFIRVRGNPNEAIKTGSVLPLSPITMSFMESLKAKEEELSGKTRYNMGTDASTLNKTATGVQLIMNAANQRINHLIKIFAETGVQQLYRFLVELNQRFIDQTQVIRLLNEPMTIQPDDLSGELDIVVNSDVGLGEKQKLTQTMYQYLKEFYPAAAQMGIAGPADFSRAAQKLFELQGWKDAKSCFRTPEEIQTMQQQQMAAMQAQAAAGAVPGAPAPGAPAPAPAPAQPPQAPEQGQPMQNGGM